MDIIKIGEVGMRGERGGLGDVGNGEEMVTIVVEMCQRQERDDDLAHFMVSQLALHNHFATLLVHFAGCGVIDGHESVVAGAGAGSAGVGTKGVVVKAATAMAGGVQGENTLAVLGCMKRH